jgi:iron complex outermembrane receptor protein
MACIRLGSVRPRAFVRFLIPALSLLIVAHPFALHAASAGSGAGSQVLEELIVTGQRRTEDLQSTGVSASVLNAEDLVDKSVFGLTALQYAAPSVTISDYGSANVFNIRGIGRSQVDVDLPSGVVIYRDGAPTLAGYFQNEPYFDMDSIEVFRGPQGTFVGKSAAGGAVFINTADPRLGEFTANVEAGAGRFDQFEFTGVVNVPVSDTLALRVGYNHLQRNDYYDRITGDYTGEPGTRDLHTVRLGALWAITDKFDALLKVDYSDLDFGGNVTSSFGDPLFDVEQNAPFQYTDESLRVVLDLKYELDNGIMLSSLTGYQDVETTNNLDLNATQPEYYIFGSHADTYIVSQEFNIISPERERFSWVLGAFYQFQNFDIPTWDKGGFIFQGFVFAPDFPWASSPWDRDEEDWALFAHATIGLSEALELELGIRYSEYKMDQFTEWVFGDGTTAPFIPWPFSDPPASVGGDVQDLSEDSVDGKIGLNWTVNEDHFVYGLVSRGHITGGVNLFPPFLPYDESEVLNYEIGWKANWADSRLRTQASVFYETFDNYQAQFAMAGGGPASVATFRNAEGKSKVWGVEITGQLVAGNWGFDFGLATLDSELGTFVNVQDPFTLEFVDLTGAKSPFSPELTANLGIEYTLHLGGVMIRPRVDYAHLDETQAGLWDSELITLDKRDLVNFQLSVRPEGGNWYGNLWVTNVTNEKYAGGIQNNGTLRYAAPPRQYGLRVGYNFN